TVPWAKGTSTSPPSSRSSTPTVFRVGWSWNRTPSSPRSRPTTKVPTRRQGRASATSKGRSASMPVTRDGNEEEPMRSKRIWLVLLAVLAWIAAACTSVDEATPTAGDGATETTPAATDDGTADTTAPATTETGGDEDDGGAVAQRDYRFVVVTHGQPSDPFRSVAATGVAAAGDDMGVTVEYQAPGTFDMVEMGQIIEAAVASQPDGLVV